MIMFAVVVIEGKQKKKDKNDDSDDSQSSSDAQGKRAALLIHLQMVITVTN